MKIIKPDQNLLNKYAKAGPRYTSYPTAPVWTEQVNSVSAARILKENRAQEQKMGLYFHFPFCPSHCSFCGCNVIITRNQEAMDGYVDFLHKELDLLLPLIEKKTISQIQFGGGSPSYMNPKHLRSIMVKLRSRLKFARDLEIGIELNPETTDEELLDILKDLGFNRISFGVQDLSPEVQAEINRIYPAQNLHELIELIRKYSFNSINFDLIYGLPKQSLASLRETIQHIVKIRPHRLALYSYAHIPWLKPLQRSYKEEDLANDSLKLELFLQAVEQFTSSGYEFLGLDHFALPEDELSQAFKEGTMRRNFMGYTTQNGLDYLGVGMTSIGYFHNHFFQNHKKLSKYRASLQEGVLPVEKGYELNFDDLIRQEVIQSLMTNRKVSLSAFYEKFHLSFPVYFQSEFYQLREMQEEGLIHIAEDEIIVSNEGILFLRNIAMVFDNYLADKENPRMFSRTV